MWVEGVRVSKDLSEGDYGHPEITIYNMSAQMIKMCETKTHRNTH